MNAKKAAPLVIALLLGGLAAKMAFNLVQKRATALIDEPKRTQIVVAKTPVDAGSVLTEENLAMSDVSSDAVTDNVFRSFDQVVGRVPVVPIVQGQAVATTLLAPKGMGAGIQATIPVGMRAITMDINEVTGVAGYLVPGCHVDVVQTIRDEKTGLPAARTLAQNVKIAQVGIRHNPGEGDGGGHSITLLVTPVQAELLELASSTGRPRFSLRSGNDLATVDSKGVTLAELMGRHGRQGDEFASPVPTPGPSTQPVVEIAAPSTVAIAAEPTTRQSESDDWTIQEIHGGSVTEAKFSLRTKDSTDDQYSDTFPNK